MNHHTFYAVETGVGQLSGFNAALILIVEAMRGEPSTAEREAVVTILYAARDQLAAIDAAISRAQPGRECVS